MGRALGLWVRGPTCTRCMAWVWPFGSRFHNPQSSGRPARSTPPKREVKSTKGRTGYSPTPPVTNPSGAKPKSARAAMERRGQQPGDAQQPGKDGAGDSPPPPPPVRLALQKSPRTFLCIFTPRKIQNRKSPTEQLKSVELTRLLPCLLAAWQFLEVSCRSSGKVRRFAAGTTARYALHAINRKLGPGAPPALHVEAVRDGEEPVSFGPSAALVDYGRGWRLQTVTAHDAPGIHHAPHADTVCHDF